MHRSVGRVRQATFADANPAPLSLSLQGVPETIKKMLVEGHDINRVDYDNRSALHVACAKGHLVSGHCLVWLGDNASAGHQL